MTQEEKQLLLKDLCGRLRYGVRIHINSSIEEQNRMQLYDVNLESETIGVSNEKWTFRAIPIIDEDDDTKIIKPYLRPMSSMTEEELKELNERYGNIAYFFIQKPPYYYGLQAQHSDIGSIEISEFSEIYDWLNAHQFDYHKTPDGKTMIEAGLALEAKEGMYKNLI